MIHLPDKVKVGGQVYDVYQKEVVILDDSTNYSGKVAYIKNQIEILQELNDQRKVETFLHELVHAMFYEAGYSLQDEVQIEKFGKILYQVVKDNHWQIGIEEVV